MPENPLLPNRKLQQLYASMLRARGLAGSRLRGTEAILATLAQQLEPGDAVLPFAHAGTLGALLQPSRRGIRTASVLAASASPLAFAAGVATGAQLAGAERLVVALLNTHHPEPAWAALLAHAQHDRLPLIVICPEAAAPRAAAHESALTWKTLTPVVKKLNFPVLTVDSADAVAMYRAMQESVLRARHGDGPALLWCLMPGQPVRGRRSAGNTADLPPLARLQRYMSARRIPLSRAIREGQ